MDDLLHRSETKVSKQPHEPPLRCFQIEVMRRRDAARQIDARMGGIDLPRMQIEHRRLAESIDTAKAGAGDRVRENAEIRAAGDGDVLAENAPRRDREFTQRVPA